MIADDIADPPELDIEDLLDQVHAALTARLDDSWRLIVRSNERRHILAQVAMPPVGWAAIEVVEGSAVRADVPIANGVVATERSVSNGLVSIEVADDGTFRL